MLETAQKAIYLQLTGRPGLVDLLADAPWGGPAIYDTSAPKSAGAPYLVMTWASISEEFDTQVVCDLDLSIIDDRGQDSFSRSSVYTAGEQALSALDRFRDDTDRQNLRVFFTGSQMDPDADARITRMTLSFEVRFNRPA